MKTLTKIIITGLIAIILSKILPGVHIDTLWTGICIAIAIAILNVTVKPILVVFTAPITVITLGLFLFVINVIIISLADYFVEGFVVDGFFASLLFSICLSTCRTLALKLLKDNNDKNQQEVS